MNSYLLKSETYPIFKLSTLIPLSHITRYQGWTVLSSKKLSENNLERSLSSLYLAGSRGGCDRDDPTGEAVAITDEGERVPVITYVVPFSLQGRKCLFQTFYENSEQKKHRSDFLMHTGR